MSLKCSRLTDTVTTWNQVPRTMNKDCKDWTKIKGGKMKERMPDYALLGREDIPENGVMGMLYALQRNWKWVWTGKGGKD